MTPIFGPLVRALRAGLRSGRFASGGASQRGETALGSLFEVVITVGAAFVLALLIQQFLIKPFYVPTVSMEPTIMVGDRVLAERISPRFSDPERGQIVVFRNPRAEGEDLIKRVVAVGGDSVAVRDGKLWVNGEPQDEPYLKDPVLEGSYPEQTVPPGNFFAMGDNRNNSGDSRVFGPVPDENILGRAVITYWPLGRAGFF